jgi:hypothetical protein
MRQNSTKMLEIMSEHINIRNSKFHVRMIILVVVLKIAIL